MVPEAAGRISVVAGAARGYITAWFMYCLQGDEFAGDAFIGDCEICSNKNWDVKMKNLFFAVSYSYLSASMGFRRAALRAGK